MYIGYSNCPLFIWSEAIVVFVVFLYLGQCSARLSLTVLIAIYVIAIIYCVFVLSGKMKIDEYIDR